MQKIGKEENETAYDHEYDNLVIHFHGLKVIDTNFSYCEKEEDESKNLFIFIDTSSFDSEENHADCEGYPPKSRTNCTDATGCFLDANLITQGENEKIHQKEEGCEEDRDESKEIFFWTHLSNGLYTEKKTNQGNDCNPDMSGSKDARLSEEHITISDMWDEFSKEKKEVIEESRENHSESNMECWCFLGGRACILSYAENRQNYAGECQEYETAIDALFDQFCEEDNENECQGNS